MTTVAFTVDVSAVGELGAAVRVGTPTPTVTLISLDGGLSATCPGLNLAIVARIDADQRRR